jgi:hypothetical protein
MRLTRRLAGALVPAALIVVGVLLASRPVGDEQPRARATALAYGTVVATRHTWDGSQLLTVTWAGDNVQPVSSQFEDFRASPVWPAIVVVIGIIGSIVIAVSAGANALAALPTAWIFILPLIVIPIRRYRRLARLLRMPHVARHGVVASVTSNWRGATVPIIAMSADRTVRLRLIGERHVPWLVENQDVTLSQLPTASADALVLATEDGHAALAIATTVQVQKVSAVEPTG